MFECPCFFVCVYVRAHEYYSYYVSVSLVVYCTFASDCLDISISVTVCACVCACPNVP